MTMTSNSPGFRALRMLKAHGQPMSEEALAVGMEVDAEEVGGLLGYPIRIGAIRRSKVGDHYYYRVGDESQIPGAANDDKAAPLPAPTIAARPAAAAPVAAPAPAPSPAVAKPAPKLTPRAVEPDPLRIPTLAEHLRVEPPKPWMPDLTEATASDAADVVEEAFATALGAGLDIDAIYSRVPGGIREARELVSSALSLLQVRRFDCAQFSDGRLVLELDGTTHHLSAAQAAELFACMESGSQTS